MEKQISPRVTALVVEADKWVEEMKPLIDQYAALDAVYAKMLQGVPSDWRKQTFAQRAIADAAREVEKTKEKVEDIITGYRDNSLCDVFIHTDRDASDEVAEQNETDNDAVRSAVYKVETVLDEAVKQAMAR